MVDKDICEINHKNINEKIDRLEKRVENMEKVYEAINQLALEMQKNVLETQQLRVEMNSIIVDVGVLKYSPVKKYEELVKHVSFTIIGALITYLLIQLGLK